MCMNMCDADPRMQDALTVDVGTHMGAADDIVTELKNEIQIWLAAAQPTKCGCDKLFGGNKINNYVNFVSVVLCK